MELSIYNNKGEKTSKKIILDNEIFGVEPHKHSVYLDVRSILASRRRGTHKTKSKADLSGSTRKLRKQKGSGFARVGSIKSPIFRGGARVFGPVVRDYSFKINKKVKVLARKSVFSQKFLSNDIFIVDSLEFNSLKTKNFVNFLSNLSVEGKKVLMITFDLYMNLSLCTRNISKVVVSLGSSINTYDLLNADKILIEEKVLDTISSAHK